MTFLFNGSLPRLYDRKKFVRSYAVVKFPVIIARMTLITSEVAHSFICRLVEHIYWPFPLKASRLELSVTYGDGLYERAICWSCLSQISVTTASLSCSRLRCHEWLLSKSDTESVPDDSRVISQPPAFQMFALASPLDLYSMIAGGSYSCLSIFLHKMPLLCLFVEKLLFVSDLQLKGWFNVCFVHGVQHI